MQQRTDHQERWKVKVTTWRSASTTLAPTLRKLKACSRMFRKGSERINGDRINGLFHLLINGVYWGYNPLILTIDLNFQRDILVVYFVIIIFSEGGKEG